MTVVCLVMVLVLPGVMTGSPCFHRGNQNPSNLVHGLRGRTSGLGHTYPCVMSRAPGLREWSLRSCFNRCVSCGLSSWEVQQHDGISWWPYPWETSLIWSHFMSVGSPLANLRQVEGRGVLEVTMLLQKICVLGFCGNSGSHRAAVFPSIT